MRRSTLYARSLTYHWRTNVAVALGVAIAGAALTGALLVGDSMRQSLLDVALGRLGEVDDALISPRYITAATAHSLQENESFKTGYDRAAALISVAGGATHAESRDHAERVNIYGVDESFWHLFKMPPLAIASAITKMPARSVAINRVLADELHARVGDDILLRMGKPADVSTETLLGRRDDTTATLRLPIHAILPATGLGVFSTKPQQLSPRNAFVPLRTLQRALHRKGRVNAMLVVEKKHAASPVVSGADNLQRILDQTITLADMGLTLRVANDHGYVALESDAMLIDPAIERIALAAGDVIGAGVEPVFTQLANRIQLVRSGDAAMKPAVIPYSTIAAIPPDAPALSRMTPTTGETPLTLQPGEILLNAWAANDLGATIGDAVALSYYTTGEDGTLQTESHTFTLAGIVKLDGAANDPGWIPPYPGVTDTENLAEWDAPFPVDFSIVRDKDEDYWDQYRTTPKAFVTLEDGQRLWAHDGERLGRLTSIRFYPKDGTLNEWRTKFEAAFLKQAHAASVGLRFDPVRKQAIEASHGSTDFGMLFIGFSFFLIGSAAMLVALLFRLGVERRASEVGLLFATGYEPRSVRRLLMGEGLLIAAIGGAVGLAAAQGYAWLMLAGLRSWWSSAANAPFLKLHATPTSFAIGYVATIVVALGSIRWSIRGLARQSTRSLLSGAVATDDTTDTRATRRTKIITAATLAGAIALALLPAMSKAIEPALAFFGSGALILTTCLSMFSLTLRHTTSRTIHQPGTLAVIRLGIRNARRNASRSVLTASLVASATFIVASLQVFRVETTQEASADRSSGTGGFTLMAEAGLPLPYDLATDAGRDALGLSPETNAMLRTASVMSLRLKPGDDSSCLSLYQAKRPRIIGAPDEMIRRGGFTFSASLAETSEEKENPWRLLRRDLGDGVVPVIGDDSTVLWLLKLGVGKDLTITDERGREVKLRFVALLKGSVLRNELVISAGHFKKLFPSRSGTQFFLIDAPLDTAATLPRALERDLEPFSMDAVSAAATLNRYLAVQNTYLSTFQTLGGLGLVLGTLGLAAVMLRNVWERRRELALLGAIGYSPRAITLMVLSENAVLLGVGLASGCLAAAVAVAPNLIGDPGSIAWGELGLILAGILLFGFGTSVVVLIPARRANLVRSLRFE